MGYGAIGVFHHLSVAKQPIIFAFDNLLMHCIIKSEIGCHTVTEYRTMSIVLCFAHSFCATNNGFFNQNILTSIKTQ